MENLSSRFDPAASRLGLGLERKRKRKRRRRMERGVREGIGEERRRSSRKPKPRSGFGES